MLLLAFFAIVPAFPIDEVYSTDHAFIALDAKTGTAQCWGMEDYGGKCDETPGAFAGMSVYSSSDIFFALNSRTGVGICWGGTEGLTRTCDGMNFTGVTDVYSTRGGAFLALDKKTSTGQCWGRLDYGGDCSGIDFTGVTVIVSTYGAFFAFNGQTERVQWWGYLPPLGGQGTRFPPNHLPGVTDVYATSRGNSLLALNRNAGTVQCWGSYTYLNNTFPVNCSQNGFRFEGAQDVYSNQGAYLLLNKNTGIGHCFGPEVMGGSCSDIDFTGVTDVVASRRAFCALNNKTGVFRCWGSVESKFPRPDSTPFALMGFPGPQTKLYAVWDGMFFALNKEKGTGICWGTTTIQSSDSYLTCRGRNFTGVTIAYSSNNALFALNKKEGIGQCWGGGSLGKITCGTGACNIAHASQRTGFECACLDGFNGFIRWSGLTASGQCTAAKCDIAGSNNEPGPRCACKDGFDGSIRWDVQSSIITVKKHYEATPRGACTPALCGISNSNGQSGPRCACADGFTGSISWSGATPIGQCDPAPCSTQITNSNGMPGLQCACADSFAGKITWSGSTPTGTCSQAPCEFASSNRQPGFQCVCRKGYNGRISWTGSTPKDECIGVPCTIVNSNGKPGEDCACDNSVGEIRWRSTLDSDGNKVWRSEGHCETSEEVVDQALKHQSSFFVVATCILGSLSWAL